jgi:hypothetical protein
LPNPGSHATSVQMLVEQLSVAADRSQVAPQAAQSVRVLRGVSQPLAMLASQSPNNPVQVAWQEPPAQVPAAFGALQAVLSASDVQVPSANAPSAVLQTVQSVEPPPPHWEVQQTPSTQKPLAQPEAVAHGAPTGRVNISALSRKPPTSGAVNENPPAARTNSLGNPGNGGMTVRVCPVRLVFIASAETHEVVENSSALARFPAPLELPPVTSTLP